MKDKIQIILEELRNLESAEGSGTITEEKINEICKAYGVSFEEFRSSILEMLADEAGISADELESLSFEEISEVDLDKISGGAGVSDTVKRGAASLMAILNLGSMASSYAAVPSSSHVGGGYEITAKRNQEEYDDDEMPEEQAGLNKEAVKKWAKRLGIPAAAAGVLLCICMLNNSSTPAGKVKTISAEELHKMPWVRTTRSHASAICASNGSGNEPSLKSKCYVHMSDSAHKDAQMYIVGVFRPNDGSKPSILISDDKNYLGNHKNSGTVQVFDNGLSNSSNEIERSIIARIRKTYVTSVRDSSDGSSTAPGALPGGESKRLTNGREVSSSEQPEWTILSEEASRPIAAELGGTEGPTKYFVHLSNYKPEGYFLRIVGSADNGKTVLISDARECVKEIKQINDHKATSKIIKKWEGTKVFVYDSIDGLLEDGIIDRLETFYGELKNITVAPTKPAATAKSTSTPRSVLPSDPAATRKFAAEIYDFEHELGRTPDGKITTLKKDRLALQLSDEDFETSQKEMTDVSSKLLALEMKSKYYNEIQQNTWQCKFASTVLPQHRDIFKTFGFGTEFDDLALGIIGTENMDYYQKETYLNGGVRKTFTSGCTGTHHGVAKSSGRTSGRYARLYRDTDGKLHALQKTPEEVMNARSGMILNLLLKTLTKNNTAPALYDLPNTIRKNAGLINTVAKEIQNMNAYHHCSGGTFTDILKTKSVISMDQLLDPLVAKNDKERLKIMWDSLSAPKGVLKPDDTFEKLIDNYGAPGVAEFLKTCVGGNRFNTITFDHFRSCVNHKFPIESLRDHVRVFETDDAKRIAAITDDAKRIAAFEANELDKVNKVDAQFRADANLVFEYMKKANRTSLTDFAASGLGSKHDAKAGTNTTVFSILGGNKVAIEEYALKGQPKNSKGCIIEIPKECVSYVSPYAILLDANISVKESINRGKGKYAVIRPKDDADKYNDGIDLQINTGCPGEINTTGGLIAFADHPYIDKESWAGDKTDKYTTAVAFSSDRQISQLLRSRKLDPRNKKCATVLAIYMYCQYVILHDGKLPTSVKDVLETNYQTVGSHACIEGHSPGEIPLGGGGVQRVLMIGYDEKNTNDKKVIEQARNQGLKVKCISAAPATRAEFIAAFNGCT